MDLLVANVEHFTFEIEIALKNQDGALPLPFPGMDKSGAAVCEFHVTDSCPKGMTCPFRHVRGDKTVVCKHWLRGLCKKGDQCEFLHEYDMTRMPECYFYTRFDACYNKECPFRHVDPESQVKDWSNREFCWNGPTCNLRNASRILCKNYLAGFCPAGADCPDAHPRVELPRPVEQEAKKEKKIGGVLYYFSQGHKVAQRPGMGSEHYNVFAKAGEREPYAAIRQGCQNSERIYTPVGGQRKALRNIENVVCYKCGEKGHFANRCKKNYMSFKRTVTSS